MKTVFFVFSDMKLTTAMQMFGVFEPSKVIGCNPVEAEVSDTFTNEKLNELVEASKNKPFRLIGCVGSGFRYSDPEVKSISDGQKWTTLDKYLDSLCQKGLT